MRGGDGPSARILVAFCSEMPLICSRTRRGLYMEVNACAARKRVLGSRTCMRQTR